MEIGTLLFAMAASCACARSQPGERRAEAVRLADVFCADARRRIREHFRRAGESRRRANALASEVLDGRLEWMEQGIITS
jgi:hypothetical protein